MEWVPGLTLDRWIAQHPNRTANEWLPIFRQVVQGLRVAHRAGVVHRDVKPGNVLLTAQPEGVMAKLGDFGLAKVVRGNETLPSLGKTLRGRVDGHPRLHQSGTAL